MNLPKNLANFQTASRPRNGTFSDLKYSAHHGTHVKPSLAQCPASWLICAGSRPGFIFFSFSPTGPPAKVNVVGTTGYGGHKPKEPSPPPHPSPGAVMGV